MPHNWQQDKDKYSCSFKLTSGLAGICIFTCFCVFPASYLCWCLVFKCWFACTKCCITALSTFVPRLFFFSLLSVIFPSLNLFVLVFLSGWFTCFQSFLKFIFLVIKVTICNVFWLVSYRMWRPANETQSFSRIFELVLEQYTSVFKAVFAHEWIWNCLIFNLYKKWQSSHPHLCQLFTQMQEYECLFERKQAHVF